MNISKRLCAVKGQPMFGLLTKAREMEANGKDMIHFELGDTDFQTPATAVRDGIWGIHNGNTHYCSPGGIPKLKMAAQMVTARSRKFTPCENQLLVTPGANIQTYLAMAAVCDTGDLVAIPVPYFPSYVSQAQALGLTMCFYNIDDPDSMKNVTKHRTKAIILNSPSNPSGKVWTKQEITNIYEIAQKCDALLICDEVYSRMIFEGEFFSASMIDHCDERVVVVNGFSKSFAMSGWRLGVVTGPKHIIEKMTLLQETLLSCVPPFIQEAGAGALLGNQDELDHIRQCLEIRRELMWNGLNVVEGIRCDKPQGGLYCWADIRGTGMMSEEYADKAMDIGVVLCPGTFFGCDGYVRLCYGTDEQNIMEGMERLRRLK